MITHTLICVNLLVRAPGRLDVPGWRASLQWPRIGEVVKTKEAAKIDENPPKLIQSGP